MKPASLIFLVFSLILLIGGYMTCGIATSMANAQGVKIYDQTTDASGDTVYTFNLSDDTITKLALNFVDVDVNIIGGAEQSYIEIKNFDANSYSTTLSGATVTVDGNVGFFSSMIDMSQGGLRFKGLRYFLVEKPDPARKQSVNVYLTDESGITSISASVSNGTLYCKNIAATVDYNFSTINGNIELDSINTPSVAELRAKKGSVIVKKSLIGTVTANVEEGEFKLTADGAYTPELATYTLTTVDGKVFYNNEDVGSEYKITSPAPKCLIKVNLTAGQIHINDN